MLPPPPVDPRPVPLSPASTLLFCGPMENADPPRPPPTHAHIRTHAHTTLYHTLGTPPPNWYCVDRTLWTLSHTATQNNITVSASSVPPSCADPPPRGAPAGSTSGTPTTPASHSQLHSSRVPRGLDSTNRRPPRVVQPRSIPHWQGRSRKGAIG
jgi:hypothetical protein